MPAHRIAVRPEAAVAAGLAAVRAEFELPAAFPPEAEAEAAAARDRFAAQRADRTDVPLVTIDPPGSRDLDQALHLAPTGTGWRVFYAIADVAAFVVAGSALDAEAHRRGTTVYLPDHKVPLHPPALSEGSASLLPDGDRPALLWTLDLDAEGALTSTRVERAVVRSRAQLTYADVPAEVAGPLQAVGELRLAQERARGGVRLAVPEQEVEREADGWRLRFRAPLPTEEWNAQISLLTGAAAARLMLDGRVGLLRTQGEGDAKAIAGLRRQAAALGVGWPEERSYPEWLRGLDPAEPAHAALLSGATGVGRGARYTAFDGAPPEESTHWALAGPYAHVTAPLRRLADRFALETCLALCAGEPVPDEVRAALPGLPAEMAAADKRANAVDRAVVDLVEAVLLEPHVGEAFDAVALDERTIALAEPAVRARVEDTLQPGERLRVRLESADAVARKVVFRRS